MITSLWRVGDKATSELMLRFYGRFWAGESATDALREAKLEFLAHPASAHPADWAAFTIEGDGNVRLPIPIRWTWLAIAAALGLVAVRIAAGRVSRFRRSHRPGALQSERPTLP